MLQPVYTNAFSRDMRRLKRRSKNMAKIKKVMELLINKQTLPEKYREHALIGNYRHRKECHIESDWLLIYKINEVSIIFERTGTHSDLF